MPINNGDRSLYARELLKLQMDPRKLSPPVIKTKYAGTKSAQKCICAGCMLGNLTRRPTKSSVTTNTGEMTLKQSHVYPGSLVFADQYESSVPGRRYESFGRENTLDKFKGGTLFYDAMPTLIFINHQTSSCTGDTLASKHKFEAFADLCAVDILGYRADNHISTLNASSKTVRIYGKV